MKNFVTRATLLSLSLFLALFVSEAVLRIFWNPPYLDSKYKRDDFSWMSKNVVLNNFGYRDSDTTLLKPADKIRIYSLGDSFTYGWYIDDYKLSYPNVLEKKLRERLGDKVEVINASQPGFKIKDSIERFKTEGVLFSPDIVTLGINLFDLTSREFPTEKPKLGFLTNLRLYELIFGNLERARVARLTQEHLKEAISKGSEQLKRAEKEINELNKIVDSNGAVLILVFFPDYDAPNPNKLYSYQEFHERIQEIAQRIKIIDLLDAFEAVKDKRELILNPTDNHPTVLAHSLAAGEIMEEFDFANFILTKKHVKSAIKSARFSLGRNLGKIKGIIWLGNNGVNWVSFDREFDLGVQKRTLENTGGRRLSFMTDYLKTAKSLTHDGWVGAKIEMHFPASREIVVNNDIYGYPVVGVSGFTAFGRRDGSTFSRDLDLSKLEITRNEENFKIKVLTDVNWDFYRVNFDVAVRQVDLDKNLAVSFSGTERLVITVKKGDSKVSIPISSQSSLPKFIGGSDSYSYVWYGNSLKKSKLTKINNQLEVELAVPAQEEIKLEIPLAVFLRDKKGPVVKYLL